MSLIFCRCTLISAHGVIHKVCCLLVKDKPFSVIPGDVTLFCPDEYRNCRLLLLLCEMMRRKKERLESCEMRPSDLLFLHECCPTLIIPYWLIKARRCTIKIHYLQTHFPLWFLLLLCIYMTVACNLSLCSCHFVFLL
jgi:hypothetical protein